jgi:transposase InsO family protein
VTVTAAGSSFTVLKKGTAVIFVLDTLGRKQQLHVSNCLISDKFPYKLLALQSFTSRGFSIQILQNSLTLSNNSSDVSLRATHDKSSRLFILHSLCKEKTNKITPATDCCTPATTVESDISADDYVFAVSPVVEQQAKQLLARSYTSAEANNELWRLHLRHGHVNFHDLCRQYGIPPPQNFPVCVSCLMGKSHVFGHDSGQPFLRASRPGEGFHSDFRGPYPVQTPSGASYLLTIIDDFSRRIFGFLVKSQVEWYDIFPRFVTRIEAELGKSNCVSWLLTDNGGVYCAQEIEQFYASKGIQHRLSAPYSQWMDHTAERNMRTVGEMALTMLIHANLPKKAWGWATLQSVEVLNRTANSKTINAKAGAKLNASRLEKWKGVALPTQGRGLSQACSGPYP